MFPVNILTFVLVSEVTVRYAYSEGEKSINSEGCGVRIRGQSFPQSQTMEYAKQSSLEDNLETGDGMLYDDIGMESRIVGGTRSTVQWPWMVGIVDEGFHACGGSIIDDRHVLTAAHCFDESDDPRNYEARIGELKQGDSGRSHEISWIKVHEEYTGGPTYFNDIALLKLRDPLPVNAVPICLPSGEALQEGDTLTITGFGATEEGGDASRTLQEVHNLPVIATAKCDEIIRGLSSKLKGVTKAQICTGDEKGGMSSCQGDSGGPVTFEENGRWFLLGLVSYSAGCARPGIPTVHTRVSSYRDWIDRNIAEGEKNANQKPKSLFRRVMGSIF